MSADDDVRHYDQSTFLAHRAIDAEAIGPPPPPKLVALPGARAAVDHDRLLAHQDLGHGQDEIVERVNARWEAEHAERLEAHRRWRMGPYQHAVEEMRRRETEAQAEEMRKRAAFEALIAEREARDAGHA